MVSIIESRKDELFELCQKHHVKQLDVFGSAAVGDFTSSSDIDFVVEFNDSVAKRRFDNFFELLDALKKLFGRYVDLVEPGGLRNPYFAKRLEQTRRSVYVAS
jgi:predicted nucleotidyltransferase